MVLANKAIIQGVKKYISCECHSIMLESKKMKMEYTAEDPKINLVL